ncbi:MAG: C40 family peptidase [Lachnospiraceae bacterium]|nr:C40 family peptidase [Lachnospiraceae bacterium]
MTGTTGRHHKSIWKVFHRLSGIAAPVFLCAVLIPALAASVVFAPAVTVRADKISDLEQQKSENEQKLQEVQQGASALEAQQEDLEGEIGEMQMSLAQNLVSIEMLEEEIAELDAEIEVKQQEYDAALAKETEQYEQMKRRIKLLYEKGNVSYMEMFVKASSFSDLVNKSQYVEQLAEYDRTMLIHYQEAKQAVEDARNELEDYKAEQEASKHELETERSAMQSTMNALQAEYDEIDAQVAAAEAAAAEIRSQIQAQQSQITQLQEEARRAEEARRKAEEEARRKAQEAAAGTSSGSSESSGSSSAPAKSYAPAGSLSGQNVANYACQFVGNPYVYGGTSLTNGCDCSGFTMSVYRAFGVSIPRTAEAQRGAGIEVPSIEQALPGDLVCYPGHVGIYIGNGTIVHASTARTGIKYSPVTYRAWVCIRRIAY